MASTQRTHDELVAEFTGGLAPEQSSLPVFAGNDLLRPDGRPRPDFRAELRRTPNLRNALACIFTLAQPFLFVWAAVTINHWAFWPVAFLAMGTFFARNNTLFHEAAHRQLFSNRRINDLVGERIFGWLPYGDGSNAYRLAHTQHHRDEFGPKEPDFGLYARYPIPKDSMRRKLTRDAIGVSGYKNLRPILIGMFRSGYRKRTAITITGQVLIFALFWALGQPWMYLVLWFAPWMTYWRVVNRLRSLAEHAGMTRSDDRRRTTHHIRQSIVPQTLFTPYNIGFHLAHHVDSGVSMHNLAKYHQALEEAGYWPSELTHPTYRSFWKTLVR